MDKAKSIMIKTCIACKAGYLVREQTYTHVWIVCDNCNKVVYYGEKLKHGK